jgi:hypothetical protein
MGPEQASEGLDNRHGTKMRGGELENELCVNWGNVGGVYRGFVLTRRCDWRVMGAIFVSVDN